MLNKNHHDTLRVLYISDFSASFPGSFIESLYLLAEEITLSGGKVWFIFPYHKPYLNRFKKLGNLYFVPSFMGKKFDFTLLKIAFRLVNQQNISIVHTQFGLAGYFTGSILAAFKKRLHISHERSISKYLLNPPSILRRLIVRSIFRFTDFISHTLYIAISTEAKRSLVEFNGFPNRKIFVIPNAILETRTNKDNSAKKTILADYDTREIVGMVAHFGPAKDHFGVLEAARIVVNENPSVLFVFVGGNLVDDIKDTKSMIEKQVSYLNLQNNVIFAGEIQDPYVIIKQFNIGLLISNWEGFGNVLVEYMLQKKPVIGTSIGGIKDVIIDGKTGFLVPPKNPVILAEKILWLLRHKEQTFQMGEMGYQRAKEKYNILIWKNRILEIYNNR